MEGIKEQAVMMVRTLEGFRGKSSQWLHDNVDWLRNISLWGIDSILDVAEHKGWVYSKVSKDNRTLLYYPTQKGIKEYNKYNPS